MSPEVRREIASRGGRGGKPGNPQFKKVAERIGEWVHGLGIPIGVKPNHAWRHLFKSVARHVRMDREVEGFIIGHRPERIERRQRLWRSMDSVDVH